MKKRMLGALAMTAVLAMSGPASALSILDVGGADQLDSGLNLVNSGNQLLAMGFEEVPNSDGSYWSQVDGTNLWAFDFGGSDPFGFLVKTGNSTFNTMLDPDGPYNAFLYTNLGSYRYAVIDLDDYYFLDGADPYQKGIDISRVSHVNSVPEPGTLLLLGSGLLGLGILTRRRK